MVRLAMVPIQTRPGMAGMQECIASGCPPGRHSDQQAVFSALRRAVTRLVPVAAVQAVRPHGLVLRFSSLNTVTPQAE